jgi:N-acylneuraminate cytidylyltransferase
LQSKLTDRVIVSTDDPEIREVALAYGAEAPFLRPPDLAQDDTPDLPVFQHALTWMLQAEGYSPEIIVHLRPTSPLRPPGLVDQGIALLRERPQADSVRAVTRSSQTPYKMWRLGDDGHLVPLLEMDGQEPYNMPRQRLPATYWQTGHLDVVRVRTGKDLESMTGRVVFPLIIDSEYAVDVDGVADLDRAEALIGSGRLEIVQPSRRHQP